MTTGVMKRWMVLIAVSVMMLAAGACDAGDPSLDECEIVRLLNERDSELSALRAEVESLNIGMDSLAEYSEAAKADLRAEANRVRSRLEEMRLQRNQELKRAQDARSALETTLRERDEARGALGPAYRCLVHFLPPMDIAEINDERISQDHYDEQQAIESVKQQIRTVLPDIDATPTTPQQSGEGE